MLHSYSRHLPPVSQGWIQEPLQKQNTDLRKNKNSKSSNQPNPSKQPSVWVWLTVNPWTPTLFSVAQLLPPFTPSQGQNQEPLQKQIDRLKKKKFKVLSTSSSPPDKDPKPTPKADRTWLRKKNSNLSDDLSSWQDKSSSRKAESQ